MQEPSEGHTDLELCKLYPHLSNEKLLEGKHNFEVFDLGSNDLQRDFRPILRSRSFIQIPRRTETSLLARPRPLLGVVAGVGPSYHVEI